MFLPTTIFIDFDAIASGRINVATSNELNQLTVRELASIAKELGIGGWHEMRKDELVRALVLKSRTKAGSGPLKALLSVASKLSKTSAGASKSAPKGGGGSTASAKEKRKESPHRKEAVQVSPKATLSPRAVPVDIGLTSAEHKQSRLVLMIRDSYWLQAYWEVDAKAVERAKVALGPFWHTAVPVLRLFRLESDGATNPRRRFVRDVNIHGGVNHWYIDVTDPPSTFQMELGYLSRERKFHPVVSSNNVTTPQRQIHDDRVQNDLERLDGNWRGVDADIERIFKLSGGLEGNNRELKEVFEKKLQRPMSASLLSRFRASQQGAGSEKTRRNFDFHVAVDIIIHGRTDPSVQVSIRNEPISVAADGSFSVRFSLPEKRHVFPIDAEGSDGVETQRVILAVERNTKILETLFHEPDEDE